MARKAKVKHSSEMFERLKMMQVKKRQRDIEVDELDYTTRKGYIKGLIEGIKKADVSSSGAQLAYFFLLSLFPLLIFILTLVPFLNLRPEQVFLFLETALPSETYNLISSTLREVLDTRSGSLLSIGIIATLWSASNGVNALIKSLNRSYGIEETRPFLIARGMSLILTLMFIVLIIVALVLPVFGQTIGKTLFNEIGLGDNFLIIWQYVRIILPPILIASVLIIVYWVAPNMPLYLKSVIPGALFATAAWIAVSYGFSFYISNFANYSKTYGSIGGIIVLMLWLYIIGIVLVIGGQLNVVTQRRTEQKMRRMDQVSRQEEKGKISTKVSSI